MMQHRIPARAQTRVDGAPVAQLLRISEETYHSDPCREPSLSASIAKALLDESPLHAWHAHPRLGGAKREAADHLDRGSLIHKLVLGAGAEVEPIEADDWRTKAAREARDAARAAGRIPVLASALEDAQAAAGAITKQLRDVGIELDGESEASIVWREFVRGADPVWARGRLDHLLPSGTIYDLKTTGKSAHPRACVSHVINHGYDVQAAAYSRAVSLLWPDRAGRVEFVFLFVEVDPPYAVTPCRLDAVLRERGERRWQSAVQRWASCLDSGDWPGYASEVVTLESPGWLASRMEEG